MTKKAIIPAIYGITAFILCFVLFLGNKYNIPLKKFTADPALIFKANPFIGIISNLGVLLWCSSASISFFSGTLLLFANNKNALFLIYSGIFTTILLLDDFFMIHDYGIYYLIPNDYAEKIIFLFYALFGIWYLFKFYPTILSTNYKLLFISFIFLGSSMTIDSIFESKGIEYFIEDSLKFIGIVSWSLFFTITSYNFLIVKTIK